jgi:hypothetical protein
MRARDRTAQSRKVVEHLAVESAHAMHDAQAIPPHAAGRRRVMAFQTGARVVQRPETLIWREVGPEQVSTAIDQIDGFALERSKCRGVSRRSAPGTKSRQFEERTGSARMIGKWAAHRDPDLLRIRRDANSVEKARPQVAATRQKDAPNGDDRPVLAQANDRAVAAVGNVDVRPARHGRVAGEPGICNLRDHGSQIDRRIQLLWSKVSCVLQSEDLVIRR